MASQVANGKAFEWAIALAIQTQTRLMITQDAASIKAAAYFAEVSDKARLHYQRCADAAVVHILEKERAVMLHATGTIHLAQDAEGQAGDVRDVIMALDNGRTIGISAKTNHDALKHPRLSGTNDFVKKWGLGEHCSAQYWADITPLFDALGKIRHDSGNTAKWDEIANVATRFYWPILDAFEKEVLRIKQISQASEQHLCRSIIQFLIGQHDFYKVIATTAGVEIQAFNFHGSLSVVKTKVPDCINSINNKNGGQYSKTIAFNRGYAINFRIHSASSRVEPSLKFDVRAIGLPSREVYKHDITF